MKLLLINPYFEGRVYTPSIGLLVLAHYGAQGNGHTGAGAGTFAARIFFSAGG